MIRKRIRKCALALALPSAAALMLISVAPSAMAATAAPPTATPAVHFDGSPGTSAPPGTLGPYDMTPAAADTSPIGASVSGVTLPNGTMAFSPALEHLMVGNGWATWSNGYTGDVYADFGTTVTMTLPVGTGAFYFYAEPNLFGAFTVEAVAQNGTTSGPVSVNGFAGATYFGFYGTGGATIKSIIVTVDAAAEGFAVGEFGAGTVAQQLSDLLADSQGVGPGTSLADKVTQIQSYLASGDVTDACGTLGAYISEVHAQTPQSIPPATAAELLADAHEIQTILGC
jgi:hypothetical protein